jgi:hypothetical protein
MKRILLPSCLVQNCKLASIVVFGIVLLQLCQPVLTPVPTVPAASPVGTPAILYSVPELKYILINSFGGMEGTDGPGIH